VGGGGATLGQNFDVTNWGAACETCSARLTCSAYNFSATDRLENTASVIALLPFCRGFPSVRINLSPSTLLNIYFILLITPRQRTTVENAVSNCASIVACSFIAVQTCLFETVTQ
jgi:hypothetical protein